MQCGGDATALRDACCTVCKSECKYTSYCLLSHIRLYAIFVRAWIAAIDTNLT